MRFLVPVLSLIGFVVVFQNCGKFSSPHLTALSSEAGPAPARPHMLASDCRFGGGILTSGQSVAAFQNSTVPSGQTCVTEIRTCSEGVLSGSYSYSSCTPAQPNADCLFDGKQIPHGASVSAYLQSTADSGACVSESRRCENGILSGSFVFSSCSSQSSKKDCVFNGQQIFDGEIVKAFPVSSVASGSVCAPEVRTCSNGVLSGAAEFASCAVNGPRSCVLDGQTIANGGNIRAFFSAQPARGMACEAETRTCSDGSLSGTASARTCVETSFNSCSFAGTVVAHGQSVTAYPAPTHPTSCVPQLRQCLDGMLTGANAYASCVVTPEASCRFNGVLIASRDSVTAFKEANPASGTSCERETRTCTNGTLSGSFMSATCQDDKFAEACKTQPTGTSYYAFREEETALNQPCRYEIRTCTSGTASGSFRALSCVTCHDRVDGVLLNPSGTPVCFRAYVNPAGQPTVDLISGTIGGYHNPLVILTR